MPVSAATLLWLVCAATYVYLDHAGGALAAGFYFGLLLGAQRFHASAPHAVAIAAAVHALAWFMQIVPGHALLEKRRPALLDSLVQSLLLAPFFIVLELLFLLGYKPALHAELARRTSRALGQLRAQEANTAR